MGDAEEIVKKTTGGTNGFIKGNKMYNVTQGHKYKINFDTSTATVVNVMDKTARSAKAAKKGLPAKGDWVMRFDKPHVGAEFNHINLNPTISGVRDPHIKLPPGGLTTAKGTAKFCQVANKINKVAIPVAIAIDVVQTGVAVYHDIENGTSRNTVETVAGVAGGWGGGYGGAMGGAAIGSAIFPGVGTIIGGIIGGIGGGIGGSLGASYLTEEIADAAGYDVVEKKCKRCGRKFLIRVYRGETRVSLCQKCS